MSYYTITSSFKLKDGKTFDDVDAYMEEHIVIIQDANSVSNNDGEVALWFESEGDDDIHDAKSDWKKLALEFADFEKKPVEVTIIDSDREPNEEEMYYIGPMKLILAQSIKDREEKRDLLEKEIATLRRQLMELEILGTESVAIES